MDLKLSLEYRAVSLRAEHVAASPFSDEQIVRLIENIESVARGVEISKSNRPLSTDPDDDMILDLAISGRADTIVTNNIKHLLQPAARFQIAVNRPSEFLRRLTKEI